jgi:hypothetical protein
MVLEIRMVVVLGEGWELKGATGGEGASGISIVIYFGFCFVFETGPHCVAQSVLELLSFKDSPTSTSSILVPQAHSQALLLFPSFPF